MPIGGIWMCSKSGRIWPEGEFGPFLVLSGRWWFWPRARRGFRGAFVRMKKPPCVECRAALHWCDSVWLWSGLLTAVLEQVSGCIAGVAWVVLELGPH